MDLDLRQGPSPQTVFNAGISVDNMTWWFWIKAGMGFTVGAGCVYVLFGVLWLYLISQVPALVFLRAITRF